MLHAPFVHTLKQKRAVVKPLVSRLRAAFNASVCEADAQDVHQTIVLCVAMLASDSAAADSCMDHVLRFIQSNTEANIVGIDRELR
jgi:hypothetical protein